MSTDATLTSKGQITIPKEIRDRLGLQPGDGMTFTLMPDSTVVMRVKTRSIMDLAGVLRKKGRKAVAIVRLSRGAGPRYQRTGAVFGARPRAQSERARRLSCGKSVPSRYGLQRNQITDAISGLLDAAELELEDEPTIEEALYLWKDSAADFADCLTGAHHRRLGCRATATVDARAVKLPGFVAG